MSSTTQTIVTFSGGFFFPFIFISWRLITLQYCSGFCHTLTWISHGFTCIPHPDPPSHLPLDPIPLALPSAQVWALVSCIQPGLVICFTLDNIHVSMLLSWNIPPSPSPTESWWFLKYNERFFSCCFQDIALQEPGKYHPCVKSSLCLFL